MATTKRPGQDFAEAQAAWQEQERKAYFEGIQIVDIDYEIIDSRLLWAVESMQVKAQYISPNKYKIA